MRNSILIFIKFYQRWVSPLFLPTCRFEPSCSHYACEAIQHFGLGKGLGRAVLRILKCHPFHPGGFDPVK